MSNHLSGTRLFLRWTFWPCAHIRLNKKQITDKDFRQLEHLAGSKIREDTLNSGLFKNGLLRKCFPNAFKSYLDFTKTEKGKQFGNAWELPSVAEYWHHHHRHLGEPEEVDVWLVPVLRFDGEAVVVLIDNRQLPVENYYDLPVKIGDKVYVHKHTITEICKEEKKSGHEIYSD